MKWGLSCPQAATKQDVVSYNDIARRPRILTHDKIRADINTGHSKFHAPCVSIEITGKGCDVNRAPKGAGVIKGKPGQGVGITRDCGSIPMHKTMSDIVRTSNTNSSGGVYEEDAHQVTEAGVPIIQNVEALGVTTTGANASRPCRSETGMAVANVEETIRAAKKGTRYLQTMVWTFAADRNLYELRETKL